MRGCLALVDGEENPPLAGYCCNHANLRQSKGLRNHNSVLGQGPPSFSLISASYYALIDIKNFSPTLQDPDVFLSRNLPLKESLMLIKSLADHTQDSEPHPKHLSKVFSHRGGTYIYPMFFL